MSTDPSQNAPSTATVGLQSTDGASWTRLIQITDPHLFASPEGQLLGMTTRRSFEAVLELALSRHDPATRLVLTGDLVHDESAAGYAALRARLDATGLVYHCIPGNHDSPTLMREQLGAAVVGPVEARRLRDWNLIFLDSTKPGCESGLIGDARRAALESILAAAPQPALIFLHQHPLPIGSAWMDRLGLEDGPELLALCDRYPQVKALVCGHVHQAFARPRHGYWVLGTPSTCVQFKPGSHDFAVGLELPGYRELRLGPNGRFATQIVRLDAYAEQAKQDAAGY